MQGLLKKVNMIKCAVPTKIHCIVVLKLITRVFSERGRPLKAGARGKEFIYTILDYDVRLRGRLLHTVPEDGKERIRGLEPERQRCVYRSTRKHKDSEMLARKHEFLRLSSSPSDVVAHV